MDTPLDSTPMDSEETIALLTSQNNPLLSIDGAKQILEDLKSRTARTLKPSSWNTGIETAKDVKDVYQLVKGSFTPTYSCLANLSDLLKGPVNNEEVIATAVGEMNKVF